MRERIKYVGYWGDGKNRTYIERIDFKSDRDFKGSVVKHGYLHNYSTYNREKGWFRVDNKRTIFSINPNTVWESGEVMLDIKTEIREVKLKKIYECILYDREEMPQTDDVPAAVKQLKERGITVKKEKMTPAYMKPSQTTLDAAKVKKIAKDITPTKCDSIVMSLDDHIVDGHHRWAALKSAGYANDKVSIYRIMLTRRQAIQVYREVTDV
jgi:hypothetical protein